MTEATCKRELEFEIPAENVEKATDKLARDYAKMARIPGFRPGKAPIPLIRRRFASDLHGEVVQNLVPEFLEQVLTEKKMIPVTRPQVEEVSAPAEGQPKSDGPLKFKAIFEVLPEFELGDYKDLEIEVSDIEVGDPQIDKAIEEMRDRSATMVPVEGRPVADADFVQLNLKGTSSNGGDPIDAGDVLCHIGADETLASFNENLRGASVGDTRSFETTYPEDYPDPKLTGKIYAFTAEILGIKEKKLPELNDEFAKDLAGEADGVTTMAELRVKVRERLEKAREQRQGGEAREKILETLVKKHDFPVPEALTESQMDSRLERVVRQLASQGVDPRGVNVDWASLRERQRERSVDDVKAELLLDRIATAENIDASDEEVDQEVNNLATASGESATSLRARLTKQGALDRMKSKLRSDKTLEWLYRKARIQTKAKTD
jgi:trigger factor